MTTCNIASTDVTFSAPYNCILCDGFDSVTLTVTLQAVGDGPLYDSLQLAYNRVYNTVDGPALTCNPVVPYPVESDAPCYYRMQGKASQKLYEFLSDCTDRMVSELILMDGVNNPDAPVPICDDSRRDSMNTIVMQALYDMVQVSPYDCTGAQATTFFKDVAVSYLGHYITQECNASY